MQLRHRLKLTIDLFHQPPEYLTLLGGGSDRNTVIFTADHVLSVYDLNSIYVAEFHRKSELISKFLNESNSTYLSNYKEDRQSKGDTAKHYISQVLLERAASSWADDSPSSLIDHDRGRLVKSMRRSK